MTGYEEEFHQLFACNLHEESEIAASGDEKKLISNAINETKRINGRRHWQAKDYFKAALAAGKEKKVIEIIRNKADFFGFLSQMSDAELLSAIQEGFGIKVRE